MSRWMMAGLGLVATLSMMSVVGCVPEAEPHGEARARLSDQLPEALVDLGDTLAVVDHQGQSARRVLGMLEQALPLFEVDQRARLSPLPDGEAARHVGRDLAEELGLALLQGWHGLDVDAALTERGVTLTVSHGQQRPAALVLVLEPASVRGELDLSALHSALLGVGWDPAQLASLSGHVTVTLTRKPAQVVSLEVALTTPLSAELRTSAGWLSVRVPRSAPLLAVELDRGQQQARLDLDLGATLVELGELRIAATHARFHGTLGQLHAPLQATGLDLGVRVVHRGVEVLGLELAPMALSIRDENFRVDLMLHGGLDLDLGFDLTPWGAPEHLRRQRWRFDAERGAWLTLHQSVASGGIPDGLVVRGAVALDGGSFQGNPVRFELASFDCLLRGDPVEPGEHPLFGQFTVQRRQPPL
ncbi:MAG: hypothetical protein IT370_03550 [Deltaproteobacteria bacterium]|nr:hypothetical protein [Deltaproteobacteria bacterium]